MQEQGGGMHEAPPARKPLPYPSKKAEAIFDAAYTAAMQHHRDVCMGTFHWLCYKCGSDLERKFLAAIMFMDVGNGGGYGGPLATSEPCFVIEPQKQCGDYAIDFAFTLKEGAWFGGMPEVRVAVEIDGAYWHDQDPKRIERDRARDRYLSMQGWRVMRFSEREVNADAHACAKQVQDFIEAIGQEHVRIDMAQGEAAA
jgi:very-short-patch-repair endonuclease